MIRNFKNLLAERKNDLSKREYINLCRELVMIFDMEADSMEADLKQNGERENSIKESGSGLIMPEPRNYITAQISG